MQRIAIIGGGISGLAAAQRLVEVCPTAKITLFEASNRLGGVIQTTRQEGFVFEHSADSFIINEQLPWAGELCDKLGLELIPTSEKHRGALILRGLKFHPVPDGLHLMSVRKMTSILTTPLLSWRGRLRVAVEPFVAKKKDDTEESLEQFATRRFGREMFERIIQPLVSGIYTADPKRLSVAAALPQFVQQESRYGSLARAAASAALANQSSATDRGARYSLFRTPRDGMDTLISKLEAKLSPSIDIRKNSMVQSIRQDKGKWNVDRQNQPPLIFDSVLCATNSAATSKLLSTVSVELADHLASIEHVSTAVICFGFRRNQIHHALNAFGCVIPAIENRKILAISFTNVKFPNRAPADSVLLRVFVGGALQPELAQLDDAILLETARAELGELLGVKGEPMSSFILRWPKTTPQYHIGHVQRTAKIDELTAAFSGLEIAGNAYKGVGVPQCIRSGWQAADRLLQTSPSG